MDSADADTVVLIHGLWVTPLSWEHWVSRFEARGLTVIAPGYPGIGPGEEGVEAIRQDSSPLAGLGVQQVADHLAQVIEGLATAPIIMGHSFGGAFVQLLLDRGLGSAGVAIDGAAVKGVNALPLSQVKATFPVLRNPANSKRAVPITEKQFNYAFTNNLSREESKPFYDRYAIPVSGRMVFQGGVANYVPSSPMKVNFGNSGRAPLLHIAGGNDHILPPAVQRANYTMHAKKSSAVTAFKLFEGRDHLTCAEPGWEAVADFALTWAGNPKPGELT
jgi:alpha-beta hydrolase superfamily lysophospholipase